MLPLLVTVHCSCDLFARSAVLASAATAPRAAPRVARAPYSACRARRRPRSSTSRASGPARHARPLPTCESTNQAISTEQDGAFNLFIVCLYLYLSSLRKFANKRTFTPLSSLSPPYPFLTHRLAPAGQRREVDEVNALECQYTRAIDCESVPYALKTTYTDPCGCNTWSCCRPICKKKGCKVRFTLHCTTHLSAHINSSLSILHATFLSPNSFHSFIHSFLHSCPPLYVRDR